MCSHCGTIRNYRKLIEDNFQKIKERKEKLDKQLDEDRKDYAIDPCNANEALLLEQIFFILQYIGIVKEE